MKRVALQKAAEHLELAKAFIAQMKLDDGFKAYERAWSQFLSQASRFYSKIEQGAKGCQTSEPWFGRKKHERRKDPLLSYIHHARDCDEHTIEHITSLTADFIGTQIDNEKGLRASFEFMVDDRGRMHYRNFESKNLDGEDLPMMVRNPAVALLTVHDRRFGDKFDPPEMHLGRPIVDTSPRGVAALAITYLEDMLKEASALPLAD
jgi:hypothetical protein